jgi:hypothetical protein
MLDGGACADVFRHLLEPLQPPQPGHSTGGYGRQPL